MSVVNLVRGSKRRRVGRKKTIVDCSFPTLSSQMRPVSNNRRPRHWPQLIFAARCCGFLRKTGRCVSAALRADDSSRAQRSSSGGRSSGQAWRVCSKEQCGKKLPDSAGTLATAALSTHFPPIDFLLPSFCPFVWLHSAQPGAKDEDLQPLWYNLTEFQHEVSLRLTRADVLRPKSTRFSIVRRHQPRIQ